MRANDVVPYSFRHKLKAALGRQPSSVFLSGVASAPWFFESELTPKSQGADAQWHSLAFCERHGASRRFFSN